jgi:integrase
VREYRDWLLETKIMKGTAKNRISGLATLVTYGQKEIVDKVKENPFERIDLSMFPVTATSDERRAYAMRELNSLFNSRIFTGDFRPSGQTKEALYWAPILGPFVGGRIEEIAQLRIEDVELVNGVWAVQITEMGPDQKVKNDGSTRRIPIHNEVIQCGFLAYVALQKLGGHERVFPSLKNDNENRIWSNALTKRFGVYLDEIGLPDPRLTYHSFRYNFRQQCSICGIENEVRDALSGHWVFEGEAGRTYMKDVDRQYPFPFLVDAIQRLSLTHLYVADPWKDVERALLI